MVAMFSLPPLRQELALFAAPFASDGTPSWTLHDPPSNRFFHLAWPAFEIISRWALGSVEAVMEAVNRETTLNLTEDDVFGVLSFLEHNFLLEAGSAQRSTKLAAAQGANRLPWFSWLLKNYLFFRIPLFRPQRFLDYGARAVAFFYSGAFLTMVVLAAVFAAFLVSRQWDVFLHSFTAYQSWSGLAIVGCAIIFAKFVHELGHAFTAHRYGCRVPTMGIAFVVLTPMLYTDTNETWKLTSRRQRLAIGIAGMTSELIFSLAAIWIWLLLPDGALRGAAFILATTTWVLTVLLNISPFMRFDGYFILSDILGLSNLHTRSFAFGRWWLREKLFGLGEPTPEPTSRRLRNFLIVFAYAAWLYRFFLFLAIAFLVYHYFFKALGIFLFLVEIGWFILLPIYEEANSWWRLREKISFNFITLRTILIMLFLLTMLIIPWHGQVTAPAILSAGREQQITAPFPAMVIHESASPMKIVRAGDILIRLSSPDLEQKIRQAGAATSVSRWQVAQQAFHEDLLKQGNVLRKQLDAGTTEIAGLLEERERLTIRAPFDGSIVFRNDELNPGVWVFKKELLYVVADMKGNRIDAYVGENDLKRISVGNPARFIPDVPEFRRYECVISEIDRVNLPFVDEPSLSSIYKGPIETRQDAHGFHIPNTPVFRIHLSQCSPSVAPPRKLRGTVALEADKKIILIDFFRYVTDLLIKESGF